MVRADTVLSLDAITAWTAVTAIATALLVVGAGAAAWFARGQVRFAAQELQSITETWREENRAYVIAEFDPSEASPKLVDFVVRNVGRTPAFDVTITWNQRPDVSRPVPDRPFADIRMFREPIAMLPPGREHRVFFDSHLERKSPELPNSYVVTVSYRDRWGEQQSHDYPLDFDARKGGTYINVKGIHEAAKALETLSELVKKSPTIKGPVEVVTESRREAAERERIEWNQIAREDGLALTPPPPRRLPPKRRGTGR